MEKWRIKTLEIEVGIWKAKIFVPEMWRNRWNVSSRVLVQAINSDMVSFYSCIVLALGDWTEVLWWEISPQISHQSPQLLGFVILLVIFQKLEGVFWKEMLHLAFISQKDIHIFLIFMNFNVLIMMTIFFQNVNEIKTTMKHRWISQE